MHRHGSLQNASGKWPEPTMTAETFELGPLEMAAPEQFLEIVNEYQHVIELALDERVLKTKSHASSHVCGLVTRLVFRTAAPRDRAGVHVAALKCVQGQGYTQKNSSPRSQTGVDRSIGPAG